MQSYKQWDGLWGKKPFAGETMKVAGCGATAVADIVEQTPDKIADYITSIKGASNGSGTYHWAIVDALKHYGYDASKITSGSLAGKTSSPLFDTFKKHIQNGMCGVILFGGTSTGCKDNRWCSGGHYCSVVGYKDGKYLVYDPYTAANDGYHDWNSHIAGDVKHLFVCSKKWKSETVSSVTNVSGTISILTALNVHNKYSFSDESICGKAYKGEVHQVVEKAIVDGVLMYKTVAGKYITGSEKYIKYSSTLDKKITTIAHCQTYGNIGAVSNGCVIGTIGEGKRLEGFSIKTSIPMVISAYCQKYGWKKDVKSCEYAGTKGESKRLEAVKIKRTDGGSVEYRAYLDGKGWTEWYKDGAMCGTKGESRAIQAIQIKAI